MFGVYVVLDGTTDLSCKGERNGGYQRRAAEFVGCPYRYFAAPSSISSVIQMGLPGCEVSATILSTTEPNWLVTTLVGAAIGALIPSFGPAVLYPFRRLRKDEYVGSWNEYYWTWYDGSKQMWTGRVSISRGVLRPYVVRIEEMQLGSPESGNDATTQPVHKYRGGLRLEGGHVIFELRATTHTESVVTRFPQWIPSSSDRVVGIWFAFDHSGTPTAGATLLTKDELEESEAKELLGQRVSSSPGLLRVGD